MLTPRQHQLLMFIDGYLKRTGGSPSFREMADSLQLRSASGAHRLLEMLVERGFVGRVPNRARALEVLRLPPDVQPGDPLDMPLPCYIECGDFSLPKGTPLRTLVEIVQLWHARARVSVAERDALRPYDSQLLEAVPTAAIVLAKKA